jgi:hypothetical protein
MSRNLLAEPPARLAGWLADLFVQTTVALGMVVYHVGKLVVEQIAPAQPCPRTCHCCHQRCKCRGG